MSEIHQAQNWLKTVTMGQPLHRDDLGAEDESSGTLRGISPSILQLAPQLKQELAMELSNAPKYEGPAMSVPGMSPGGNTVKGPNLHKRTPKPPTDETGKK